MTNDRPFLWLFRLYSAAAMGALAGLFNEGATPRPDLFNLAWALLYAASLPYILTSVARGLPRRSWIAVGLALFLAASPLWSALPAQSVKFGTAIALNILFAAVAGNRMRPEELAREAARVILALLVVSVAMVGFGIDSANYIDGLGRTNLVGGQPVQGIFSHKNFLGLYAALGLVLVLATFHRAARAAGAGLCLWGVIASGSATGLLAAGAGLTALLAFTAAADPRRRMALAAPALALFAAVILLSTSHLPQILQMLGRDQTLTGRTDLWAWALWFFEQKPIIGWGYGGIFPETGPGPADILFDGGYAPPHFHSGYLQVLAETGLVGLGLSMLIAVSALARLARAGDRALAAALVMLLCIMPAINLLLRYNDFATILMIAAYVSARLSLQGKAQTERVGVNA